MAFVAVAAAVLAVGQGVAYADTVTNNVTVGGTDTTTVGSTTSVAYTLNATNDLGEPGNSPKCNASSSSPVVVTVSMVVPNGTTATVNPNSLSFSDCGIAKSVSLGASKAGDYSVSISTSAAKVTTTGTTFTLHVKAAVTDTTGPVLTLPSDQTVEATRPSGATLAYTATAFDAGDNKATTVSCSTGSGSTFPIGVTTVSCTSSDSKGNSSSGSFKVTVADTTGPVLALSDTAAEATSAAGAKVTFSTSANDAVDGSTPVSCTPAAGSQFAVGVTTVSCAASDSRGNTTRGSLKVTVTDTTAPSLTLPTTTVAEATGAGGAAVDYTATAKDLVDGTLAVSCDHPAGSTFGLGSTTVTCSATDAHGNTATGTFSVSVGDTSAPTLNLTSTVAEATGPDGADVSYGATALDVVDGVVVANCQPGSGSTFALGTTVVKCSANDAAGNTAMGELTVTVQDRTAPSLTLADETDEATSAAGAAVNYATAATDLVDGTLPVQCDRAAGSTFPLGATTVHCSAADKAGNTATGSFVVTVKDRTAPTLLLANQEKEATGPNGASVTYDAKATDLVDGSDPVSCDKASGATFPIGTTTVSCSATDKAGNKAADKFTVTVVDTTPPSIDAPSKSAEATGPNGAPVKFTATAADLVDGAVSVSCEQESGATFPLGATTFACSARDSRGNFAQTLVTITVVDTTPPEVTTQDVTAEATGPSGASVAFSSSAADLVDGTVAVSCTPASGSTFALGTTTVTCSASDAHGNAGTSTSKVTVQDTVGPKLTLNDQTLEATGPDGATALFTPTAADVVSGARPVSCEYTSGTTFPLGVTSVACKASDAAGNETTGSFTVTVGDHTAPALTLTDAQAEATKPAGADVSYAASAQDVVDGARPVDCTPASGSTFPIAETAVACSASDTRGNEANGTLKVTVTDNTPPTLTLTDQKAEASSAKGAVVTYAASASDIVDGSVAVSCDSASGASFPLGVTTVHCSATDGHGNTGKGTFTVSVNDTTAPKLSLPANQSAEATSAAGAAVSYAATASDAVDGVVTPTCDVASGATFPLGATTVTCSASDDAGNTASDSFTVAVVDTTAPVLSVKDVTAEATNGAGASVTYGATAKDIVDGSTSVTCTIPSGGTFKIGDTLVTCHTADQAGNAASADFTVTVQDTQGPVLAKPSDVKLTATSAAGAVASFAPTAIDAVDGTVAAQCVPASGSTFPLGVTQVSCQATDKVGNRSSIEVFSVTVTAPWSNVLAPLNSDGSSTYKIGSTVPVKFQLIGTAAAIANLPARLYYAKVSNSTPGTEVEAASTSAADTGNFFRYDATARQYVFNLSTKGFSEGTYLLRIDLGDGVSHTVTITSKK